MAHGTPDWGVTAGMATTYQLQDLGELAARLGSPDTFDRRGDIVWWDDFECSLNKWSTAFSGAGGGVVLSTAKARNGRTSCLLTGGSDGARTAEIQHGQTFTSSQLIGWEISVNYSPQPQFVFLDTIVDNGGVRSDPAIRLDPDSLALAYKDATGNYVTFATSVVVGNDVTRFHTVKLVFDPTLRRYVRAIVNSRTFSLAGIAARSTAAPNLDGQTLIVRAQSHAGVNNQVYVDDVIITQNEPA